MARNGAAVRTTRKNLWGYPVRTSSDSCIDVIDSFYQEVFAYGRNRAMILQAPVHDPNCVLANTLVASFLQPEKPVDARSYLNAAASRLEGATHYERAVFKTVDSLLADELDDDAIVRAHSDLLTEFPKDLMSLKRVEIVCFYTGRPNVTFKLIHQVLPYNQGADYIHGMLAFSLLEMGLMTEAEAAARKEIAFNRRDTWAQHNLCHILQSNCRFREAVEFMLSCSSSWDSCSSLRYTHNWWHVAACYLEGHAPLQRVLEIYDGCIMKELERSDSEPSEVYLNALGLLLRIALRGRLVEVQGRVQVVATVLARDSTLWHIEWLLDILALWALSTGKESAAAEKLLGSMRSKSLKKQQSIRRGCQLAEAMLEYGIGHLQKVYDLLGPEFDALEYKTIGASDIQIDVFNEVYYLVLIETGRGSLAVDHISKRVGSRGGAPFLWRMLEQAYSTEGELDYALAAAEKAKTLEAAYFN